MWTCLEVVLWGDSNLLSLSAYQQFSSVVLGYQTGISSSGPRSSRNHQASAESSSSQQDQLGCQQKFSAVPASLNELKISKDTTPRKYCKASYASVPSLSLSPSYTLSKYHVFFPQVFLSKKKKKKKKKCGTFTQMRINYKIKTKKTLEKFFFFFF